MTYPVEQERGDLLAALWDLSGGTEFIEAAQVARRLRREYGWEEKSCSANGVGSRLARLERESRCDGKEDEWGRRYRALARE